MYSTGYVVAPDSPKDAGSSSRTATVPTDGDSIVRSRDRGVRVSEATIRAPSSAATPIVGRVDAVAALDAAVAGGAEGARVPQAVTTAAVATIASAARQRNPCSSRWRHVGDASRRGSR